MSDLPTLETSARVVAVLRGPTTTVREFNTNFVAHEIAFMVLGHTFLSGFAIVEFLQSISSDQLDENQ